MLSGVPAADDPICPSSPLKRPWESSPCPLPGQRHRSGQQTPSRRCFALFFPSQGGTVHVFSHFSEVILCFQDTLSWEGFLLAGVFALSLAFAQQCLVCF